MTQAHRLTHPEALRDYAAIVVGLALILGLAAQVVGSDPAILCVVSPPVHPPGQTLGPAAAKAVAKAEERCAQGARP